MARHERGAPNAQAPASERLASESTHHPKAPTIAIRERPLWPSPRAHTIRERLHPSLGSPHPSCNPEGHSTRAPSIPAHSIREHPPPVSAHHPRAPVIRACRHHPYPSCNPEGHSIRAPSIRECPSSESAHYPRAPIIQAVTVRAAACTQVPQHWSKQSHSHSMAWRSRNGSRSAVRSFTRNVSDFSSQPRVGAGS